MKKQNIEIWNSRCFEQAETHENNFPKKRKSFSTTEDLIPPEPLEYLCSTCSIERGTLCLNCSDGVFIEQITDQRKHI